MDKNEKILSDYIDDLNAERTPDSIYKSDSNPELAQIVKTAQMVRSLKELVLPEPGYPQKLANAVAEKIQNHPAGRGQAVKNQTTRRYLRKWVIPFAAAFIAVFLLLAWVNGRTGIFNTDVVYAMEKAAAQLSSYHGVLEMSSKNEAGEEWMVRRVEFWVEGNKYAVRQNDGTVTVNDNARKWQIRPNSKEVALLPIIPDPTRSGWDLREEAKRAQQYPHAVQGTEIIAGRKTTRLQISPPGGLPYYLWVDKETNLPVRLQTAMQNALQTTYTFISFEPNIKIDSGMFAYQPPVGYKVVENDPGQLAATVEEATAISKLTPLLPDEAPLRILAFNQRLVLDYGDTTIIETPARGSFEPAVNSALGSAAGGVLEVGWNKLQWRQQGIQIQVEGERRVVLACQIASDLTLPDTATNLAGQAQVQVPVDMKIARADQQQVDAGHVPWQLDPLQVSLTFVNLKVTPEGITGEPKISEFSFKIIANNGVEAVVEVTDGPIKKVYLKRLVRKDETGIWSVVGYDPL